MTGALFKHLADGCRPMVVLAVTSCLAVLLVPMVSESDASFPYDAMVPWDDNASFGEPVEYDYGIIDYFDGMVEYDGFHGYSSTGFYGNLDYTPVTGDDFYIYAEFLIDGTWERVFAIHVLGDGDSQVYSLSDSEFMGGFSVRDGPAVSTSVGESHSTRFVWFGSDISYTVERDDERQFYGSMRYVVPEGKDASVSYTCNTRLYLTQTMLDSFCNSSDFLEVSETSDVPFEPGELGFDLSEADTLPSREGCELAGFSKAINGPVDFAIDDMVVIPRGLNAWIFPVYEEDTVIVTFMEDWYYIYQSMVIPDGLWISLPEDYFEEGLTFTGWFYDTDCTEKLDLGERITGDMHLYAGMTGSAGLTGTPIAEITDVRIDGGVHGFTVGDVIANNAYSILWEFSDGTTSTSPMVVKSFVPGTYDVKLTVQNYSGESATATATVTVEESDIADDTDPDGDGRDGFLILIVLIAAVIVVLMIVKVIA